MAEHAFLKEDLIELRTSLGLTQQEMADQLDMALRSYQAIEAGESAYRYIHKLAAERVALMHAVDKQQPLFVPDAVLQDAIEIVRLGQAAGLSAFQTGNRKLGAASLKSNNTRFKKSYSDVGEIVLIANALDHQLNHVLMQVLHLVNSPMLEPVIATLDISRKIEMLKARLQHIGNIDWRKPLAKYLDKLQLVAKWRNLACHTPLMPDEKYGAVFAPTAAAKLLKTLQLGEAPYIERIPIEKIRDAISVGEHALGEGEAIIENFRNVNIERERRAREASASSTKL